MSSILAEAFTCWEELEAALSILDSDSKGKEFERFAFFYFHYFADVYQIEKLYSQHVPGKEIPPEIRERLKLEASDYGVDGVYETVKGALVAYQVKFRSGRGVPTTRELGTFWSEAEYADYRCIFANCTQLPRVALKKQNQLSVLVDRFEGLDSEFFEALKVYFTAGKEIKRSATTPRPYQQKILDELVAGFDTSSRGKLIAACGIRKTLVALWLSERLNCKTILFLAPSLSLIRQTLGEWVQHRSEHFDFLCVCSDTTVASDVDEDEIFERLTDLDVPVTTTPDILAAFLKQDSEKQVVFSTYQSLPVVEEATKRVHHKFSIVLCDEAHRTAGAKSAELFSLVLDDDRVSAERRLFMTATERVVTPRVRKRVEEADRVVFSMDDPSLYGEVFSKLTFGEAIQQKIIADYRVVIAALTDRELIDLINQNYYVEFDEYEGANSVDPAHEVFKRVVLGKCFKELGITKAVSFHSSVRQARTFKVVVEHDLREFDPNFIVEHVNGSQTAGERSSAVKRFESSERGLLTNVRCLSEGVDIPLIDAVYFADRKNSVVDIVQAVGRALRQPYGASGKLAYIIVPVLIDSAVDSQEDQDFDDSFEMVFNTIQALRNQDEALAEWIDKLNLQAVRGRRRAGSTGAGRIKIVVPKEIDVEKLANRLLLRIADVTKDPIGTTGIGSKLGKKERYSGYTRVFKTLGDYNPGPYHTSLVAPTLAKYQRGEEEFRRAEIKINNNNVSHAERLGTIRQLKNKAFVVTKLGRMLKQGEIDFEELFKNQMLLYYQQTDEGILFPYRSALSIIRRIETLNYIEFLYGIYSIQLHEDIKASEDEVVERINAIRENFPNVTLTSAANQEAVRNSLNELHPVGFGSTDVWTDRTTTGNQYRFFLRHIELFNTLFEIDWGNKILKLSPSGSEQISRILELSDVPLDNLIRGYGDVLWIDQF